MRRHVLLPVVFLVTLLAALATILFVSGIYTQSTEFSGGSMADFNTGWTTSEGTNVSLPGTFSPTAGGFVKLYNTLPPTLNEDCVLYLRTAYVSVDVLVDGESIYSWDIQNEALFLNPFGLSSYLAAVPSSDAGRQIELRLTPNTQGDSVSVYSVAVGGGFAPVRLLFQQNIGTVFLFFVLTVMFILVCAFTFIFRKRFSGRSSADAVYLSALIALSACSIMSESSLVQLFSRNIAVTLYISLFSLMLLPVPLLLFMRRFTPHGRRFLNLLAWLTLLDFTVCLVLLFSGVADLIQTLDISHMIELLTGVTVVILCLVEYFKYKRRDVIEVLIGLGLSCAFGVASVILFTLNGNPSSSVLARAGLTALIIALSCGVLRRGIHELARTKSYEKLTMSIPSGICRIESFQTGRIIFANEFYYAMFGYTEEDALKAGFISADFTVLPGDLDAMKEKLKTYFTPSINWYETEVRHIRKDGDIIWTLSRYSRDLSIPGAVTLVMIDITDRKQMEEKLRISEEEYRIATLHSNKHILRLDIRTKTSYRQTSTPSAFDVPPVLENVPDSIIASGMIAPDSAAAFKAFFDGIYGGGREGSVVVSVYDRGAGEHRWYHYDFTSIFDDNGRPAQAIISFYDVTLQRQKELAFQRWQQVYNAIPKSATNYYEYNLTDDRFEHEEGGMFPPVPGHIPRKLHDFTTYICGKHVFKKDSEKLLAFMSRERLLESYASGQHTDKTEFRRLTDGAQKWTSLSVQLIPDPYSPDVKGYFLLEDIDERKKAELSLQERSTLDSLTGLLNRATFIEKFNDIVRKSEGETQHALIMLDIDNFKTINDTLGHGAGDALLLNIAGKLKFALRSDDLCGRLGGDEFVICLKNMNLGKPLETRVSDLCAMICDERSWGVAVSASFGIAGFPYDGISFDELYKKADMALYKAKAQGRGRFAVYDPQLSFDDMAITVRHK